VNGKLHRRSDFILPNCGITALPDNIYSRAWDEWRSKSQGLIPLEELIPGAFASDHLFDGPFELDLAMQQRYPAIVHQVGDEISRLSLRQRPGKPPASMTRMILDAGDSPLTVSDSVTVLSVSVRSVWRR
jgi:hypothetical protein